MKKWFKYLVYVSIGFLIWSLVKNDYLRIPQIHSVLALALSFLLLFAGFLGTSWAWHQTLTANGHRVKFRHSMAGQGLSIFAKYIPGKLWVIIGRAAYISEKYPISKAETSALSLTSQIITLWVGLLFGSVGFLFFEVSKIWLSAVLFGWVLFTLYIFTPYLHKTVKRLIRLILKKDIDIPILSFRKTLALLPSYFFYWACWSAAFYLLAYALGAIHVGWYAGMGFPLAATLSIVAIIAPGGIGIREGLLVTYLTLCGLSLPEATTISVASRLWFLVGEIFIFLVAFFLNTQERRQMRGTSENTSL